MLTIYALVGQCTNKSLQLCHWSFEKHNQMKLTSEFHQAQMPQGYYLWKALSQLLTVFIDRHPHSSACNRKSRVQSSLSPE